MKICAYVINGTPLNELDKFSKQDLGSNEAFVFIEDVDPIPAGYQDISTIMNWWNFGTSCNKDYKYIRKEILILAAVIGWSNLSDEEKDKAAEIFAVGLTERNERFTTDEQIINGVNHHKNSMESRSARLTFAQIEIFNRLARQDADIITDEISNFNSFDLAHLYVERGREGTIEGDPEGLFDYIEGSNRTGTSWTDPLVNRGFRDKTFPVLGYSNCSDFADRLLEILKDGTY